MSTTYRVQATVLRSGARRAWLAVPETLVSSCGPVSIPERSNDEDRMWLAWRYTSPRGCQLLRRPTRSLSPAPSVTWWLAQESSSITGTKPSSKGCRANGSSSASPTSPHPVSSRHTLNTAKSRAYNRQTCILVLTHKCLIDDVGFSPIQRTTLRIHGLEMGLPRFDGQGWR